jgi:hypothetical protein
LSGISHDLAKHVPCLRAWLGGEFALWGDDEKSTTPLWKSSCRWAPPQSA